MELLNTNITLEGGCPMHDGIHMLISGILAQEFAIAGLTVISRGPMIECVHMLKNCMLSGKFAVAALAFEGHFLSFEQVIMCEVGYAGRSTS